MYRQTHVYVFGHELLNWALAHATACSPSLSSEHHDQVPKIVPPPPKQAFSVPREYIYIYIYKIRLRD